MKPSAYTIARLSLGVDAILVAFTIALVWNPNFRRPIPDLLLVLLVVPFWTLLFKFFGLYESHRVEGCGEVARKVFSAQITGILVLSVTFWVLGAHPEPRLLAFFFAVCTSVVIGERWILYAILRLIRRRGFDARNVCVIGSWEKAQTMAGRFSEHPEWGLRVACVGVGVPSGRQYFLYPSRKPLGALLEEVLRTQVIDELLIAATPEALFQEKAALQLCEQYGILGRVLLDTCQVEIEGHRLESFCGEVSIALGTAPSSDNDVAVAVKRVIDVVAALLFIIAISPLMLIVALLVKLSSPGPVIFSQLRVGLRGRKFKLFKFRTMIIGAEALLPSLAHRSIMKGPAFKDPADCRITNIGRGLRRFSIDELPQLFNVLKGDMSLVGPRPLVVNEAEAVSGSHRRRFSMRPGITCLWQVSGRNDVEYTTWMNYDVQYVDRWSLGLDFKLLLQTIPVVLSGKGAY